MGTLYIESTSFETKKNQWEKNQVETFNFEAMEICWHCLHSAIRLYAYISAWSLVQRYLYTNTTYILLWMLCIYIRIGIPIYLHTYVNIRKQSQNLQPFPPLAPQSTQWWLCVAIGTKQSYRRSVYLLSLDNPAMKTNQTKDNIMLFLILKRVLFRKIKFLYFFVFFAKIYI